MDSRTHLARIVRPVPYQAGTGRRHNIPIGPCLVEAGHGASRDVVWGSHGQRSALLPLEEIQAAQELGSLVLLD